MPHRAAAAAEPCMDATNYLDRMRYRGSLDPSLETLRALHRHHMYAVPFENLDIPARPIVLSLPSLYAKIVEGRRGGFCYECNALFAWLLRSLDFEVTMVSARVASQSGGFGPDFDHMALVVSARDRGGRWLADVGFGDSFVEPLDLDHPGRQDQLSGTYAVAPAPGGRETMRCRRDDGTWEDAYLFDRTPRRIEDFEAMCRHHQTSPESPFTRKRVCSLAVPGGRVTLSDDRLIVTRGSEREETVLADGEIASCLAERFGVVLPP
ncbi:MAG: arylamine N-acetyltransferase [Acidobacteriota bacterium]